MSWPASINTFTIIETSLLRISQKLMWVNARFTSSASCYQCASAKKNLFNSLCDRIKWVLTCILLLTPISMKNVAKWWQFSIQIRDLEPWHLSDIADRLFCESERYNVAGKRKNEYLNSYLYLFIFSPKLGSIFILQKLNAQ